jgi:hypothetical protein
MPATFVLTIDYTDIPAGKPGYGEINFNSFAGPAPSTAKPQVRNAPVHRPAAWVDDYLGRDVSRFFYRWGGSLSQVLARLRGRYDGDLDQFALHLLVILGELASVNAAAEARAKGAERVIVRRRGLNSQSLADISRIPRETVRRKLAAMAERQLVVREEDGLWYPGPVSDVDQFFYALSPLFWDGVRPG